ncbi:MAG: hypothetical protein JOZ69_13885 [Myxococcales bacterium]|nr:hypothetical protein [Myxococcales bacterium]
MGRRSERPTTPPAFDVVQYAKDSDAATAVPDFVVPLPPLRSFSIDDGVAEPRSQTRIVTRPSMRTTPSDEVWASDRDGAAAVVVMATNELRRLPLDHRAGFLLSLMDGTTDLETLVELSTMSRADVLTLVRDLFESGVIRFR